LKNAVILVTVQYGKILWKRNGGLSSQTNQAQASRAILEAAATNEQTLQVAYRNQTRKLTGGTYLVETE
jgi:hypothetical protein